MTIFTYNPVPKESQLKKTKIKDNQTDKGKIRKSVRDIVNARTIFAPIGCCERCKKNRHGYMRLELAHIDSRKFIDHLTTENDLLRLCGPSNDSSTCHFWVDSCNDGFEWMKDQQVKLLLREGAKTMNFNMHSPCKDCPFIEGSSTNTTLNEGRIEGIADTIMRGGHFICHKTTKLPQSKQEHCGGALQYLEREDRPNQMMRIAERFGDYDRNKLVWHDDLIESFH